MWLRVTTCLVLFGGLNTASGQMSLSLPTATPLQAGAGFHRFDAQPPWLHGFQVRSSPFTGHASFRPSNYKQAIARAGFLEAHASRVWQTRQSRPPQVDQFRQVLSAPVARPTPPAPQKPVHSKTVRNGTMSLIRSIQVAQPLVLPAKKSTEPKILRAIQREETGPLFPLPY